MSPGCSGCPTTTPVEGLTLSPGLTGWLAWLLTTAVFPIHPSRRTIGTNTRIVHARASRARCRGPGSAASPCAACASSTTATGTLGNASESEAD